MRTRLITAAAVATVLGLGLLVLQRWAAETRTAALVLVALWFVVVGAGILLVLRGRPALRLPALGTYFAIAVASAGIGYWTGFRDEKVSEDVVVATEVASGEERVAGLAAQTAEPETTRAPRRPRGPVRLATGSVAGADGHTAGGRVAVVREPGGARRLTLTDFDADPGPQVVVYLSPGETKTDDVIDLGSLKGNVGNQQYRIPADADLSRYDTLILWCVPFTTRIAVAPLRG